MLFSSALTSLIITGAASLATAANIQMMVGSYKNGTAGLVFDPETATANNGDTITFIFKPKNHTVTQSSFASPCSLLVNGSQTGFDSAYVPVAATATQYPAWTLQITDSTKPIWLFCAQGNHCNAGMVAAINPPTTGNKTFAAFKALAATAAAGPNTATGGATGVGATATGGLAPTTVGDGASASSPSATSATPTGGAPATRSSAALMLLVSFVAGFMAL